MPADASRGSSPSRFARTFLPIRALFRPSSGVLDRSSSPDNERGNIDLLDNSPAQELCAKTRSALLRPGFPIWSRRVGAASSRNNSPSNNTSNNRTPLTVDGGCKSVKQSDLLSDSSSTSSSSSAINDDVEDAKNVTSKSPLSTTAPNKLLPSMSLQLSSSTATLVNDTSVSGPRQLDKVIPQRSSKLVPSPLSMSTSYALPQPHSLSKQQSLPSSPLPSNFVSQDAQQEKEKKQQQQKNYQLSQQKSLVQKLLFSHKLLPEFTDKYTIGDELGSGGFGFVVTATRLADNVEVAVKFIYKNKVPVAGFAKDPKLGVVPIEVYILKNTHHENVVSFLDFFFDNKFYILVMELHGIPWTKRTAQRAIVTGSMNPSTAVNAYPTKPPRRTLVTQVAKPSSTAAIHELPALTRACPSTSRVIRPPELSRSQTEPSKPPTLGRRQSMDLFECIEAHNKLSENVARKIFKQVVNAVHHLLCHGIVHRDIKDENIVVDDKYQVKIIDFGSAAFLPKDSRLFERFVGTMQYCAPEILRGEKYSGPPQEVWSLGILLHTLLFSGAPFANVQQVLNNETPRPRNKGASEQVLDLIGWMLQKSPMKRVTLEQVVAHPWMTIGDDSEMITTLSSGVVLKRKVSTVKEQDEYENLPSPPIQPPQSHQSMTPAAEVVFPYDTNNPLQWSAKKSAIQQMQMKLTPSSLKTLSEAPSVNLPPDGIHIHNQPSTISDATQTGAPLCDNSDRIIEEDYFDNNSVHLDSTVANTRRSDRSMPPRIPNSPLSQGQGHSPSLSPSIVQQILITPTSTQAVSETITDQDSLLTLHVTTKVTDTGRTVITSNVYEASYPSVHHSMPLRTDRSAEQTDRYVHTDGNNGLHGENVILPHHQNNGTVRMQLD